jgi:hypothetical protein
LLSLLRIVVGLLIGVALFLVGIPVLQSVVKRAGYYDGFSYEQAVLAFLLIIACVIAAQLTGLRPPRDRD